MEESNVSGSTIYTMRCRLHTVGLPHGTQEQVQHVLLSHRDVGGVGKVYKFSHHLGADVSQGDLRGATLHEAAGEHGSEVGTTGGQDHLMHLEKITDLISFKTRIR